MTTHDKAKDLLEQWQAVEGQYMARVADAKAETRQAMAAALQAIQDASTAISILTMRAAEDIDASALPDLCAEYGHYEATIRHAGLFARLRWDRLYEEHDTIHPPRNALDRQGNVLYQQLHNTAQTILAELSVKAAEQGLQPVQVMNAPVANLAQLAQANPETTEAIQLYGQLSAAAAAARNPANQLRGATDQTVRDLRHKTQWDERDIHTAKSIA